jgi:CO/xanthine dehydrogenase FAD-binding subunit
VKPAPFRMFRPTTLGEALTQLSDHRGTAKIIAGGQSLVPMMNLRLVTPDILIDLGRVEELRHVAVMDDALVIGATVRQSEILTDPLVRAYAPLLRAAAAHIGHVQTRARGTIGGSLSHADPAAELSMVMVALGATMVVRSVRGERKVPADEFFASALTTILADDEILCEVAIPKVGAAARVAFREMSRRQGDFAIASAAVQLWEVAGIATLSASLGGVSETPHACRALAGLLSLQARQDGDIEAAVASELSSIEFLDDIFASAGYRRDLAAVLLGDCLREVLS